MNTRELGSLISYRSTIGDNVTIFAKWSGNMLYATISEAYTVLMSYMLLAGRNTSDVAFLRCTHDTV